MAPDSSTSQWSGNEDEPARSHDSKEKRREKRTRLNSKGIEWRLVRQRSRQALCNHALGESPDQESVSHAANHLLPQNALKVASRLPQGACNVNCGSTSFGIGHIQGGLLQVFQRIQTCGRRFTSEIHERSAGRTDTICTKKEETTTHPNALSDLYKTGNEPIPNFHRITFPLFTKPIPHLFVLGYGSCVSNSCGVNPPRNPRALRSKHRSASV